jgi:hypothetical protein
MIHSVIDGHSVTAEQHSDRNSAEPFNWIWLSFEFQATQRQIGWGNLSTFQVSQDMHHDLRPQSFYRPYK